MSHYKAALSADVLQTKRVGVKNVVKVPPDPSFVIRALYFILSYKLLSKAGGRRQNNELSNFRPTVVNLIHELPPDGNHFYP